MLINEVDDDVRGCTSHYSRADVSEPGGSGFDSSCRSRRSSLISIEHAKLLRSTPSLVLCCAWLVTMALHVHGGLGQLSPLPTSGDDK